MAPRADLNAIVGPTRPVAPRFAISDTSAITAGDETVGFAALDVLTRGYAARLREHGVAADTHVGVCMDRTPATIAALLACWRVGAAYVPIDPELPQDRIAFMLQDAEVAAVIADPTGEEKLGRYAGAMVLDAGAPGTEPAISGELAYVTYTSGSTGKPKGVCVSHRALSNFIAAMDAFLPPFAAAAALTSFSFDIAGLELFLPLARGARIVLASRDETRDGARLARRLEDVDLIQATPATFRMLAESHFTPHRTSALLCGGEAWSRDLKDTLCAWSSRVWNVYGPTETTIWSAARAVKATDEDVLIGGPLANTQLYVLDEERRPTEDGELYIGGAGLAEGYWRRDALTASKFVHLDGERLYATGDRVTRQGPHDLLFRGRLDEQVKIRGHRVELGEVEARLAEHPSVTAAACTFGAGKLVAFVVAKERLTDAALRHHLRLSVPEHMVPHAFVFRDALPLSTSGKVDKRKLRADYDAGVT